MRTPVDLGAVMTNHAVPTPQPYVAPPKTTHSIVVRMDESKLEKLRSEMED